MGRGVLGVIVGYLVMALIVMTTFTGAYFLLGASGSFREGSWEPSPAWIAISFVLGFIAAIAGGFTCARIGRSSVAVLVLAGVVLALGLLTAAMHRGMPEPGPRAGDATNLEAMQHARPPLWVDLVNPLVGIAGVLIGGRRREPEAVP